MWGTFGGIAFAGLLALLFEREGRRHHPRKAAPLHLQSNLGAPTACDTHASERGRFRGLGV